VKRHYLKTQKISVSRYRQYILAAMGLLAGRYTKAALIIMKKELNIYEFTK